MIKIKSLKIFMLSYFNKLKLYFIADYRMTLCLIAFAIITPVISAASIKYGSNLLNNIIIYLPIKDYSAIYPTMIIIIALSIVSFLIMYLNQLCISKMSFQLEFVLNRKLMLAYTKMDYLHVLSERGTNDFNLALNQTNSNSIVMDIYCITGIIRGIVEIITYTILLYSTLNIFTVLICIIIFAMSTRINFINAKAQNQYIVDNMKNERKANYISSLITDIYAAKEVLLNNLSNHLISKWENKHVENKHIQKNIQDKRFKNDIFIVCITEFVTFVVLLVLFIMKMIPTIGEFSLVTSAMLSLQNALSSTSQNISLIYQNQEQYSWYDNYVSDYNEIPDPNVNLQNEAALKLTNVSFRFPNQERSILKNINIEIPNGQTVAIVGENGAGKTTLINLILGLYKPLSGEILCNESNISYVSQQFAPLRAMSIRDNIYLNKSHDKTSIPVNYNKYLGDINPDDIIGEEFDGRNLSKGEIQKIAYMRVHEYDSSLMILDEPTASLDPIAEMNLFNEYIDNNKNKTILLITHRLGSVRKADRIICLKDGIIEEDGSHEELMELKGYYYNMFESQAQWYRGDIS